MSVRPTDGPNLPEMTPKKDGLVNLQVYQAQTLQCLTRHFVSSFEDLERAESDEAFGYPADHRASFAYRVSVVINVASYVIVARYATR